MQELFLWREGEGADAIKADELRYCKIEEEIADVAILLLLISHEMGIDLPQPVTAKVKANAARYDVPKHRGLAE